MKEFLAMNPTPAGEWEILLQDFCTDADLQLPDHELDVDSMFQSHCSNAFNSKSRGPYYRLTAWYSIIPALQFKDDVFCAWRLWLRWLSKACVGPEAWSKRIRDQALFV